MSSSRIQVTHLITTLDTGGTEGMLLKLLTNMDRALFSNQVICLMSMGSIGIKIARQGIPVHGLNMKRGSLNIAGAMKLWRILRASKPAILQTWLYHSDLLGSLVGTAAGVRNIFWNIRCSSQDLLQYTAATKWVLRICARLSFLPGVIITNSHDALDFHLKRGYRPDKWKVIPNGYDTNTFRPDRDQKSNLLADLGFMEEGSAFYSVGFFARFNPMKDHSTFFKAADILLQKMRNVHFILAGTRIVPENEELSSMIPGRWKDHFHLLGERDEMEKLTAALDIACLVSHGEGFPNVVCEAMSCGVPCVVTDVGDAARIVGKTGRVVPPRNPEALAQAWLELLEMDDLDRGRLGAAARRRVLEDFDLAQVVRKYERLYLGMLRQECPG
ncbi:MAG: hypothetical protein CVU57_23750 [Deltaproteobacteria bacterium HGW-Deltaproteobacteria-15]|jgi:glycosyltransferase involved in cell wall biosynthesis|nr:MAG: hypothetical protein CVU57_23750 [Deltaproteobacteria bacterium HGW-Deltaproteobacteria-15]PKO02345.1 MAG: hypothetical protein CVU43_08285 [Chloroflexi bacterium HGW-Chloroflexi-5]